MVVLLDHATVADSRWALYLHDITGQADERGLATRVFPVALEAGALGDGLEVQALRWIGGPRTVKRAGASAASSANSPTSSPVCCGTG